MRKEEEKNTRAREGSKPFQYEVAHKKKPWPRKREKKEKKERETREKEYYIPAGSGMMQLSPGLYRECVSPGGLRVLLLYIYIFFLFSSLYILFIS